MERVRPDTVITAKSQEHPDGWQVGGDPPRRLYAAHPRHGDVHQHHVGAELAGASGGGTYRIGVPGACSFDAAACFEDSDCDQNPVPRATERSQLLKEEISVT